MYRMADVVLNSEYNSAAVEDALLNITSDNEDFGDIRNVIEDIEVPGQGNFDTFDSIKKHSPFTQLFAAAIKKEGNSDELDACSHEINVLYSPPCFVVTQSVIHLIPLWSAMTLALRRSQCSESAIKPVSLLWWRPISSLLNMVF